jgi:hypothetical protein
MGRMELGHWHWKLQWRRHLFAWEEEQHRHLLEIIAPFVPSGEEDKWLWLGDDLIGFTVNSAYLLLVAEYSPRPLRDPVDDFVFKHIWKCGAPTKVCAFSWQLILDRIQTKDNLLKRRIIQAHHGICSLCGETLETGRHLFLHCCFVAKVWYAINRWLGFIIILPHDITSSLATLIHCAKNKRERLGLCLIWNAYVWVIWNFRNDCIFNNGVPNVDDVVDRIKLLSWKWFVGRVAKGPFLFYEWSWSPLDCMVN